MHAAFLFHLPLLHSYLILILTGSLWTRLLSPSPPTSTTTSSVPHSISSTKMAGESDVDLCHGHAHSAPGTESAAACVLQKGLSDSGVTRARMGFPAAQAGVQGYAVACSFNAHWKYSWRTFRSWVMGTHSGRWTRTPLAVVFCVVLLTLQMQTHALSWKCREQRRVSTHERRRQAEAGVAEWWPEQQQ